MHSSQTRPIWNMIPLDLHFIRVTATQYVLMMLTPIHWNYVNLWTCFSNCRNSRRLKSHTWYNIPFYQNKNCNSTQIRICWISKLFGLCLIHLTVGRKWVFSVTGASTDSNPNIHAYRPTTIIKRSQPCNQHLMRIFRNVLFVVVFDIGCPGW